MNHFLVSLTGARDDVLRTTPTDRPKYVAMGAVILTTACLAAVSAYFALTSAAQFPVVVGVLVGLGWGVVILNLDRMLVVGMTRRDGLLRNVIGAIPRLLLALVIGAVMSTPLVLQIFAPEIAPQIDVIKQQRQAEFIASQQDNPRFAEIPALTQQTIAAEAAANQSPESFALNDPGVRTAQARVDDLQNRFNDAQFRFECESNPRSNPTCAGVATGVGGPGPITTEKQRVRDDTATALAEARSQLAAARAAASSSAGANRAGLATTAAQLRADLTAREAERTAANQAYEASQRTSGGLLDQIQALAMLSDKRPELAVAQRTLFLLFLSLELLPVLVKLLQLTGKPSLYDQIIDRMERDARARTAYDAAVAREVEQTERDNEQAILAHRLTLERQAGFRLAEDDVEAETRRARRRIEAPDPDGPAGPPFLPEHADTAPLRTQQRAGTW